MKPKTKQVPESFDKKLINKNGEYKLSCGCYSTFDFETNDPTAFQFCPLHSASPQLLEACKIALDNISVGNFENRTFDKPIFP